MKVYLVSLVIIEDHHTDVEVGVYATAEAALDWAREVVDEYGSTPGGPDGEVEGRLYHATLSVEGDYVRVEEVEIR